MCLNWDYYVSTILIPKLLLKSLKVSWARALFSDTDQQTIHYPAYCRDTCQKGKIPPKYLFLSDFAAVSWLPW